MCVLPGFWQTRLSKVELSQGSAWNEACSLCFCASRLSVDGGRAAVSVSEFVPDIQNMTYLVIVRAIETLVH